MITAVQNLGGGEEVIIIEPSRRNEEHLHVRSARTYELNYDQACNLVDILCAAINDKWDPDW